VDEQISVKFTGDASGLNAASSQSVAALDDVSKAVQKTDLTWREFVGQRMGSYMKQFGGHGAAIKQIAAEWNQYKATLPGVASATEKVSQATAKVSQSLSQSSAQIARNAAAMGGSVKKGSNEAMQSLTNLSRVAQDAPYGFIGIANNINPLLESFQRLKASTGTTGGALKALGSSLIGGGGLGLAVGVVSSLLVVFGDKLFASGNAAKTQADKLKEAREELDNYVDSLNDIDRARVKGLQSAQEELVKLKTLYDATQNANIPLAQRKKLVDELQEQYPKYFANIKDEIILAGGAKGAYDKLTAAIIATAKARAAEEQMTDLAKQGLAVDQKRSENTVNQVKLQQQLNNLKAKGLTETSATGEERLTAAGAKANKLQSQLNGLISEGNDLRKQRNDLDVRSQQLAKFVQTTVEANPDSLTKPGGNLPKVDKPKAEKDNDDFKKLLEEKKAILLEFIRDFEAIKIPFPTLSKRLEDFNASELTSELRDKLTDALTSIAPIKIKLPVDPVIGMGVKDIPIPLHMNFQVERDRDAQAKAAKEAQDFADSINKIFNDALANISTEGLSSIGEAIGAALGGGDIANVFKSFEQTLGSAVQSLGKQMIALFITADALKKSLKAVFTNPVIGIAAGVALVAVGAAIKKLAGGGIKGFAKGGLVPGSGNGDTVPAMLTPGEFVVTKRFAPIAQLLFGGGFKMPRITNGMMGFASGGLVPARAVDRNANFSSGSFVDVNVNMQGQVRGKDIVFVHAQTIKSQRRAT
jgi:hypothetical protein